MRSYDFLFCFVLVRKNANTTCWWPKTLSSLIYCLHLFQWELGFQRQLLESEQQNRNTFLDVDAQVNEAF
jgi:hypothetical protein